MKADSLLSWDKTELANILAEKEADEQDLVEALPEISKAGALEESVLDDYIEGNWKFILSCYDVEELTAWIEEKDYEAEWERWKDECAEAEQEYTDYMNDEYYWSIIDFFFSLRDMDLAEQRGYPSKFRKS